MPSRPGPGRRLAAAAAVTLAIAAAPHAADADTDRVAFHGGADVYNKYYFRGLLQEDRGLILQPWAELSFDLYEGDEMFGDLGVSVGTWNSIHSKAPGRGPFRGYQTNFHSAIGATLANAIDVDVIYTAYLSPTAQFSAVEEIAVRAALDDSAMWELSLNPHVLVAKEVAGGRDAYLELGITPLYEYDVGGHTIDFAVPITVGLSLDDYYVTTAGNERFYGYTQAGLTMTVPLWFVSSAYGEWDLSAGVHYLHLGRAARQVNDGDNEEFIAHVGVSLGF